MYPKHFGSDPADILIRIRINKKIRLRIQDHFRLTFRPWWSLRSLSALVYVLVSVHHHSMRHKTKKTTREHSKSAYLRQVHLFP